MEPSCVRHTSLPGTSRLLADYLYDFPKVASHYRHAPSAPGSLQAAVREIHYPAERRAAMARALLAQNGPSPELARFAEPNCVAVVTGQQVGLFSGPVYTIYKALTAARIAADLTAQGTPAVAIFWLASEDHDFAEVDHADVFDSAVNPVRISADAHLDGKQRPAGTVALAAPPIDRLEKALAGFPHAEEVLAAVATAYPSGVTMAQGFRALVKTILAKLGLIFLDPLDPAIREIAAPFLADALSAAPELKAALIEKNRELANAGYHAQVHLDAKTSLFFLLENGERVTLRKKDSEYDELRDRAAAISPNALLRPVMQDYLLPTAAYIGGPGELAYFAQSKTVYDRLLGRMPVMVPRASFTLLDARADKLMRRYGLTLTDLLVNENALHERIASHLVPATLHAALDRTSQAVAHELDAMSAELRSFDPTLDAALAKSRAKIVHQVEKIRRKTAREALRRDTRAHADTRYLGNLVYPHKHLQERFYSALPFLAQHGLDLPLNLYTALGTGCSDHRVVVL